MKFLSLALFLFFIIDTLTAQIKVDSGYTVFSQGMAEAKDPVPFILGDLSSLRIKETSGGKVCMPSSMHWTFIIQSQVFQITDVAEAKKLLPRLRPKDLIYIEKIVLPSGCFAPPKQIAITIR